MKRLVLLILLLTSIFYLNAEEDASIADAPVVTVEQTGIAAIVNGVEISNKQVETEFFRAIFQYKSTGTEVPDDELIAIRQSVLENLINKELLIQEAGSYTIEDVAIEERLNEIKKSFSDEENFLQTFEKQMYNLEGIKKAISEDLIIQKLFDDIVQKVEISEDEITSFYNENGSYFKKPERIHASHILVSLQDKTEDSDKEKALEKIKIIQEELKNGADFAELAKTKSEGPSGPEGGDLGEFTRGQMVAPFEEAAFLLGKGEISPIVETQFGYHIIKIHEKYPESTLLLEEVRESINTYLQQDKDKIAIQNYIVSLQEAAEIEIIEIVAEETLEESTEE